MKYCSRLMMKLFVIAFTLEISLSLNNDTYQVKADDKNLSSADYYIKESFEEDKKHAKRYSDHQEIKNKKKQAIEFYVRKQNNQNVLHMNEYVKHPGYIVNDGKQTYFVMTLLNREWWESYKFYQQDKELKVSITKEDKEQGTVTIQIPLINTKEEIKSLIHIKIPSIHYDHIYTTYIVMNHSEKKEEKINKEATQSKNSNHCNDKECQKETSKTENELHEIKNDNNHPNESKQPTQHDISSIQTINREKQNNFSNSNSNRLSNPSAVSPNHTITNTPTSLNTNSKYSQLPQLNPFKKEKEKPNPSFNRDADKKKVAKKEINQDMPSNHRSTYYLLGSIILLAILALITTYFVKRKSESKE